MLQVRDVTNALDPKNFFCQELNNLARNKKNFLEAMSLATPLNIGTISDFDHMLLIQANFYDSKVFSNINDTV